MGDSNAMFQVGLCYYLGIGAKVDKCKAFEYYWKSAEAGCSIGIFKIAFCYRYGIGVAEYYNKFKDWLKKYINFFCHYICNFLKLKIFLNY